MSFHAGQFRDLIVRALQDLDPELASESAVCLLLGTAAQESRFGTYLRQLSGGHALGVFQVESPTFYWMQTRYSEQYPVIASRSFEELEWDLRLSVIVARLRYRIVPEPLPPANDVPALAAYWKRYFNTRHGLGTVDEFVSNYHEYVKK